MIEPKNNEPNPKPDPDPEQDPVEPKTLLKKMNNILTFINSNKGPIISRFQTVYIFFKENLYDNIENFTTEMIEKFRKLFENELSPLFNFENNDEYTAIWIKPNKEIVEYIGQFLYKFIFYFKSNNIYILCRKIENIHLSVNKEITKFDNYTEYKKTIQKQDLFFDAFVINEKNELNRVRILTVTDYITKKINQSYIEETHKTLNSYFKILQGIKDEIDTIRKRNTDITKQLKKSKNKTYIKYIFAYVKNKYPEVDETNETRDTIMNAMFQQVCKDKINKYDEENNDMKVSASKILTSLKSIKLSYDFITEILEIDNIVEILINRIEKINWEIEDIKDPILADRVKYKKIEVLVDYIKYLYDNCIPFIQDFKYEYGATPFCQEIKHYLEEMGDVINFFVFKTLGYQEAIAQKKPEDVKDAIREITINTKDLVVDDCMEAFKKISTIRETTEAIIKMKKLNNMEKLIKELKEIYKKNGIAVEDIQNMFLLIDEIYSKDPKKYEWYMETWWEINELESFIEESKDTYNVSYLNDYNPELSKEANIKTIYNAEIIKIMRIKFEINLLVHGRQVIYDKLKLVFEPNFLENTKFKHFSSKYSNNWLSYLWWFFNIGIEEEREKLRSPPPQQEEVNVAKENVVAPPPQDNAALKECESKVLKLQSELETLKNVRQHEIELMEKMNMYEKQIEELKIKSENCDKEMRILLLTHAAAPKSAKTNNPVGPPVENPQNPKTNNPVGPPVENPKTNNPVGPPVENPKTNNPVGPPVELELQIAQLQSEKQEYIKTIQVCQQYAEQLNEELIQNYAKYGDMTEIDAKIKDLMDQLAQKEIELEHEKTICASKVQQEQSIWQRKLQKIQDYCQRSTKKHEVLIDKLESEKQKISEKQEKSKETIKKLKSELSKSKSDSKSSKSKNQSSISTVLLSSDLTKNLEEVLADNEHIQKQTDRQIKDLNAKIRQMETFHKYNMQQKLKEIEELKSLLDKQDKKSKQSMESLTERIQKINKENSKLKKTIERQSEMLSKQSDSRRKNTTSDTGSSGPFPNKYTSHPLKNPKPIFIIIKKYMLDSRNPNTPILQSDYAIIQNILLDPSPPNPYRLIQVLNDHKYGDVLNELLYIAINIRIEKNKLKYVKFISSQCNIDPSVQYEYGHTILDILVRHPEYDYNMKCVECILRQPHFNINSQYEKMASKFTTPLIQTVIHNRLKNLAVLIGHPKCDLNLRDSNGKIAMDYVLEKRGRERQVLFEYFVKANQRQNQTHRYFFSDYRNIENLDQGLKDVFYRLDKPRFTEMYQQFYKNDAQRLQNLENYKKTHGGGRPRTVRRRNVLQVNFKNGAGGPGTGTFRSVGGDHNKTVKYPICL